jgi:hypothetical protein
MEKLGAVAFIGLFILFFYLDLTRIVEVHICESQGVTQYVSFSPRPDLLSVGDCRVVEMSKSSYYNLKRLMKEGQR